MLKGVGFLCLGAFVATKAHSEVFITSFPASGEAG